MRLLTEEKDKLKADLSAAKSNVAEFLKSQLEELTESLRSKNLSHKANTEEVVKAGVENFRSQFEFTSDYENLQAFFVLTEVKELHPNVDLSTIEVDYPTPEEVEDGAGQPPADGAKGPADEPLADNA
ncbi:hypothetical protein Fot_36244 [Forsythia ovata]|uniref:Uncharacterized protein n=1 Tax=Forsythia ovata TaxID=205694 RepID=A0ABD1SPI2_9LAMI